MTWLELDTAVSLPGLATARPTLADRAGTLVAAPPHGSAAQLRIATGATLFTAGTAALRDQRRTSDRAAAQAADQELSRVDPVRDWHVALFTGDEIRRPQHGNNNAYCLDDEITWVRLARHAGIHRTRWLLSPAAGSRASPRRSLPGWPAELVDQTVPVAGREPVLSAAANDKKHAIALKPVSHMRARSGLQPISGSNTICASNEAV
jgi:hypothetical protein